MSDFPNGVQMLVNICRSETFLFEVEMVKYSPPLHTQ
jgi:hypothetical protein